MKSIARRVALPGLVAAAAFFVFWPSLSAEFVDWWDDGTNFVRNPYFRGLGPRQLRWMFTTGLLGHYIPLTWLTLGLNYVLGGMDPWGYHLLNMLLHAANAAVLYLVARRLLAAAVGEAAGEAPIACGATFAALLFAVHPLRAESVAWVTERRDVLSGLFYLLAVLVYLRGVDGGRLMRGPWRFASLALFGAGLLSKSIVMTLPLTLLLIDVYPLGRIRLGWGPLLREKLPYALLALGGAVLSYVAVSHAGGLTRWDRYGLEARIALTGYSFWFYPRKLIWPAGLSPLYEIPLDVSLRQARFLLPPLGVIAVTAVLALLARRWPGGLAAWVQSIIVVAPVSGLVHSGFQLAHDRYSYLSGLGFCVLAGSGITLLLTRRRRAWVPVVTVAVAVGLMAVLAGLAWRQSTIWLDSESLWRAALKSEPSCAVCNSNLASALAERNRALEAEPYVRRAIALRPRHASFHENLGFVLKEQARYPEAEESLRRAVKMEPDAGTAWNTLGTVLAALWRYDEAEASYRTAARRMRNPAEPLANLGVLYFRQGRFDEGIPLLTRALELSPDLPGAADVLSEARRARDRAAR